MSNKQILSEIDETIDELLENALALKEAQNLGLVQQELVALEQTRESLLARLIHRQTRLQEINREKVLAALPKSAVRHVTPTKKRQNCASVRKASSRSRG